MQKSYSAHFLGVPNGAIAYHPNRQQGIPYIYHAKTDRWVGVNLIICTRDNHPFSGNAKYAFLTAQWLAYKHKEEISERIKEI